jgi:hypothetical protein
MDVHHDWPVHMGDGKRSHIRTEEVGTAMESGYGQEVELGEIVI